MGGAGIRGVSDHQGAAEIHSVRAAAAGKGGTGQNIGRDIEASPDGVQNDAGVCGGGAGCQPTGGIQVGIRAVGSQHDQSAGAGEALWREAGGAAARGRVTA